MNNVFFSAHEDLELVGAAACRITAGGEMVLFECQHAQVRARQLAKEGSLLIIVSTDIVDVLDGSELAAVIAHEAGHVAFKHVERNEAAGAVGFSNKLQDELEADAYAAKQCGAATMISALNKLVAHLKQKVSKLTNNDNIAMNHFEKEMIEFFYPRIDALRAML